MNGQKSDVFKQQQKETLPKIGDEFKKGCDLLGKMGVRVHGKGEGVRHENMREWEA